MMKKIILIWGRIWALPESIIVEVNLLLCCVRSLTRWLVSNGEFCALWNVVTEGKLCVCAILRKLEWLFVQWMSSVVMSNDEFILERYFLLWSVGSSGCSWLLLISVIYCVGTAVWQESRRCCSRCRSYSIILSPGGSVGFSVKRLVAAEEWQREFLWLRCIILVG